MSAERYLVRPGRPADADELAELNARIHVQDLTGGEPHAGVAAWTRDLFDRHHTVRPEDFVIATDTSGKIAASMVAIAQEWACGEVRMPVVQVELVGTDPAHRGHRLTERLLTELHDRTARDGGVLYVIAGVPYFYRRFGYDYALAEQGGQTIPAGALPDPDPAPATIRPATPDDADALAAVDVAVAAQGTDLVCLRDAAAWRYDIAGHRRESLEHREVSVLLDPDGAVVGYLVTGVDAFGRVVANGSCADPADWTRLAPDVLAYLSATGRQLAEEAGKPFTGIQLMLDATHPLARIAPAGVPKRPYAWYVRYSDPVALLRWWRPALVRRWRAAGLRWPRDTMLINTYTGWVELRFGDGELAEVAPADGTGATPHVQLPPGALLQLALGYRTWPEVLHAWPDAVARDRTAELFFETGFPRLRSNVWPAA